MSIEREGSLTRFTCDGGIDRRGVSCRANYEGVDGFVSAWTEAKAHGWINVQNISDSSWKHYCKDCKLELGDD
jgi:hypothetical protein